MSIETNLKKLADAAERIANILEAVHAAPTATSVQAAPAASEQPAPAPTAPVAPPAALNPQNASIPPAPPAAPTAPQAPAPAQPAEQTPASLKPEDVNAVLVTEYQRLGATPEAQQRVFGVLGEFGAKGLSDLDPRNFQAVIDQVRGLQ